ncbi:MAG: hypothetical protein KAW17_13620 [Candidatus Eisenbacteria sp.]|nr:hypothetical protein [Candidatus Eisenbacteria bacterium]
MTTDGDGNRRANPANLWIGIAVLGSLWGLSEVVLNDAVRATGLPFRAGILAGVGMLLMGMAVGFLRRPWVLLGIPVVAVVLKQLVVPVLGVSVLCKANSCLGVGLQAVVLAGVVGLAGRRLRKTGVRVASGAGAALISAVPFYFIGLRVAPCPYLLSFDRPGGFAAFMAVEGISWAVFSALLFPLGYRLGAGARDPLSALGTARPGLYYAASVAAAAVCWIVAGFFIAGVGL